MKLSCLQKHLSEAMIKVERMIPTRTLLSITNNVLLATDKGRLKLVATNLEQTIVVYIGAKIEEEGATTVPGRMFAEIIKSLPGTDLVNLTTSPRTGQLQILCGNQDSHLSTVAATAFPPVPVVVGDTVKVDPVLLREAIIKTVFACLPDESRPVLTGVDARFEGSLLTLAAADGFRLAVYKLPTSEAVSQPVEVIIPSRTLLEINRLSSDQEDPIEITVNAARSQALFRLKNVEVVSQLIQGTFPNYSQLIPQSSSTRMVVSVADFLRATKTASIFARDGSGIVRLIVTPGADLGTGKLAISARAEEVGDNMGEIDAKVEGHENKIAFNGRYLADVLGVLKESDVALETDDAFNPGVIKPIGNDSYIHVLMPMFVHW